MNLESEKILAKIPNILLKAGIWGICFERLLEQKRKNAIDFSHKRAFIDECAAAPLAIDTDKSKDQHYEVPAKFYDLVLGKNRKYSSAFWDETTTTLTQAEDKMLDLYCARGEMKDGLSVLELGCGWGSLSLYLAKRYPNSRITGLSHSASQREYILAKASERGITNLEILTVDINNFDTERRFDRVFSVEMFEHTRNWKKLFTQVGEWLDSDGKFFLHIFTHKNYAYPYETEGAANWMGRYFFTGGMMPSHDLPLYFQETLKIQDVWQLSGTHYEKTAAAWVQNIEERKGEIDPVLREIYGAGQEEKWFVRWKLFFLACEVLFGFRGGAEWGVSHYLFKKRK